MSILDELLVELGFDYDPKEVKQFNEDVAETVNTVGNLAKIAVAAAAAITGLTIASTRASDEQGKLAGEIGESVENIDALQFALERSGGSAEGMANSLQQLSIRASEASRGLGSGVEAFGLLGVSSTDAQGKLKPVSDLMLEISKSFEGLDKSKQIELADKLGIRDSIRLLQQGPSAIKELTDEAQALGVTTAQDAAIAAEFQDSLTNLWRVVKQVSRVLSKVFAPVLNSIVTSFVDWWKINKDIIEQNIPVWIERITLALKFLSAAVGVFLAMKLVGHLAALASIMKTVSVSALIMNGAIMALPALIAGVISGFILLAEDAKVFFEGGESFIGDMLEKYPKWAEEITAVAAVFATIADVTSMVFDGWSKIFDLFSNSTLDDVIDTLGNIPGFLGDVTGFSSLGGSESIPELNQSNSNAASTSVDKLEIIVQGGADTAENIGQEVLKVFEQATQDLNTTVDQ
tara:strand:+ start:21539 stop:22924 length:1386 start_codon:yes stop_codon:yes gene_type:complete